MKHPAIIAGAFLFTFFFVACETTNPGAGRVKLSIANPEWEIEEEMLHHTPLGSSPDFVLDFVNHHLVHSQEGDSEPNDIHVYVDDGSGNPYPEEVNYKVIQVHMGLHGVAQKDFLLKSNWVYISWLFENNALIEIIVTKVIPEDKLPKEVTGFPALASPRLLASNSVTGVTIFDHINADPRKVHTMSSAIALSKPDFSSASPCGSG